MEKIKQMFGNKFFRILKWILIIILGLYLILVIGRTFYFLSQDRTEAQIAVIHATRLTMDDVTGKFLPPDPGERADDTLEGVDMNENGIRDDVELAIFEKYPKSPKTRAALLQYALSLQMEFTQPFVNKGVVGEVANKQDRAIFCVADSMPVGGESGVIMAMEKYTKPIYEKQLNTIKRKDEHKKFYSYLKSGRIDDSTSCDIDLGLL